MRLRTQSELCNNNELFYGSEVPRQGTIHRKVNWKIGCMLEYLSILHYLR